MLVLQSQLEFAVYSVFLKAKCKVFSNILVILEDAS